MGAPSPHSERRIHGCGLDGLRLDLVFALRQLRRHPGVGGLIAVTLTLGIGASIAIFSVLHGVLLRPLPYEDPEALVMVTERVLGSDDVRYLSGPDLVDLEAGVEGVENAAGMSEATVGPLGSVERPEHVKTVVVSDDFFRVLGIDAALGRTLAPGDTRSTETTEGVERPASPAVLSHGLWRCSFDSDPGVIGRTVELWGSSIEVVGVLRESLELRLPPELNVPPGVEVFEAFRSDLRDGDRSGQWLRVVARPAPGTELAEARHQVEVFAAGLRQREPIHAERQTRIRIASLPDRFRAPVRTPLLLLTGAAGLVLLIACANVANLLLARSTARPDELAVRSALGADRRRVARQLLTESGLVVAVGRGGGLALAVAGIRVLRAVRPPDLHGLEAVSLDDPVLLFAALLASLTTLLAGSVPALRGMAASERTRLRSRGFVGSSGKAQGILASIQVGLSLVLLVGAGRVIRTPNSSAVRSAGIVFPLPMNGVYERTAQFAPSRGGAPGGGVAHRVLPDCLAHLLRDDGDRPPSGPGAGPGRRESGRAGDRGRRAARPADVARRGSRGTADPGPEHASGHGTLRGGRGRGARAPGRPPGSPTHPLFSPGPLLEPRSLAGRPGRRSAGRCGPGSRRSDRLRRAFPDVPVEMAPMRTFVSRSLASTRFQLVLMAAFAATALLLAGVGLYGVLAHAVRRQRRELGVRRTFGARSGSLVWLVIRRGGVIAASGLVAGTVASLLFGRFLESQLFRVLALDPLVLAGALSVVGTVAVVSALLPGLRAATVDPMVALRGE